MSLPDHARLSLVTAAESDPIAVADAKSHLRVDGTDEDAYISSLIGAATAYVGAQGILGKALTTQTWKQVEESPSGAVNLLLHPVQSLSAVKYYDTDNALQTDTLGNYRLISGDAWAYVEPTEGNDWPTTFDRPDAVQIEFVAGYDDAGVSLPENVRHAMLLLIAHWYENREDVAFGQPVPIPHGVEALLSMTRGSWYG